MKRHIVVFLVAAVFMAVGVTPAFADAGAPGTTFPDQPGTHVQNGCAAVTTNPGSGPGGQGTTHLSPTAGAIVFGILSDAGCLPD